MNYSTGRIITNTGSYLFEIVSQCMTKAKAVFNHDLTKLSCLILAYLPHVFCLPLPYTETIIMISFSSMLAAEIVDQRNEA